MAVVFDYAKQLRANSTALRGGAHHMHRLTGPLRPKVLVRCIGCAGLHERATGMDGCPMAWVRHGEGAIGPVARRCNPEDVGTRIKAPVLTWGYARAIVKQPSG